MDSPEEFLDDIADEDLLGLFDAATGQPTQPSSNTQFNASNTTNNIQAKTIQDRNASTLSAAQSGLNRSGSGLFRQTTLLGQQISDAEPGRSQTNTNRTYRTDAREEASHHVLDFDALETWVYPTNLGATRDYQFSIVKNSLFNNTLVALPTGLGKTFIAATVMLNFYRWTKSGKIIFVAPTKPLVAQQIDACYHIAGIPRSETTLLTGDIAPALRVDEWAKRRVFFMTPQTLLNDLSHGYADPKSICLLVVDEAHRAVGEYAYAKVTKLIRRFSNSFRVLALTATPGSKVETVQEVIDNLGISHCEIRTEDSIDIRQYVHDRNIEQMVLDPSDEMNLITELFSEALMPLLDKLSAQNIWYGRGPMAITTFGLLQAQKEWFSSRGKHANQGVQFMMRAIFSVLTSLAHSIKLLNYHGITPFYENMVDFRSEIEEKGAKGSKYKRQLIEHPSFQDMMDKISRWIKLPTFVGHPKLSALADCVLNHFMDKGEASGTRVIVFSEYRDSAEDIVRKLNAHRPLVKASIFVGQADGKRGEGMKQAQQIKTIEKFRNGEFNVLVATSIGEEGLDIGQVDLIVCYDASASPIRMLQRMGRTGRKRAGQIVLLLMRGKEEEQFAKSKDNYEKMQTLICEGSRFNFRFDLSTRIIPRNMRPEVDKRHIEIPVENTQDSSLPEPRKRKAPTGKKMPKKKFHMPDGVETGFQKVTDFMRKESNEQSKPRVNPELSDLEPIPALQSVVLSDSELKDLNRSYRDLPFSNSVVEETEMPSMSAHPKFQRKLTSTSFVQHGRFTKRCVAMLRMIGTDADSLTRDCRDEDTSNYLEIPVRPFVQSEGESEAEEAESEALEQEPTIAPPQRRDSRTDHHHQNPPDKGKACDEAPPKRKKAKKSVTNPRRSKYEELDPENEEDIGLTRRIKKGTGKGKGKKNQPAKAGTKQLNLDEVGDDCDRDSDLEESDGSAYGSDLLDFVVSDNKATSSLRGSPSTSPTSTSQATPKAQTQEPFFVPTTFSATQESEDIPDLDTLLSSSKGSDTPVAAAHKGRGNRRAFILDDSEDE